MATNVKLNKFYEDTLREGLRELASKSDLYEKTGALEFTYRELLPLLDKKVRNHSYVSVLLNQLQAQGKIKRVLRTRLYSRWEVKNFLEEKTDQPKAPVAEVKEVAVSTDPAKSNEEVVTNVKTSIDEMTSYLKELPLQMISYLESLAKDLDLGDRAQAEHLKEELTKAKTALHEAEREKAKVFLELQVTKEELQKRKEARLNKDSIIRTKNLLIDDMERFLAMEEWKRRSNTDHFRKSVLEKLDSILSEVRS